MSCKEIEELFVKEGYRYCNGRPEEVGIYYKYYQEGFHVIMAIDMEHGYMLSADQHQAMEEHIMGYFYHPEGVLPDFPQGFPVYHVEVLTLLVGADTEWMKYLCANCRNVWGYLPKEKRLLIYEEQPGDFFGLRRILEGELYEERKTAGIRDIFSNIKCKVMKERNIPVVTLSLIIINIMIYLIMELLGDTEDPMFIYAYGGVFPTLIEEEKQWWRLLTSGFVHFGIEHLVNNMLILWCMGSRLERITGSLRMAVIYLLSLLGGSLLSYWMMLFTGDYAVSAGASGAVFGVIGAFLWLVICNKGQIDGITTRGILIMILLTVYFGISAGGVDNWGHIGGVVTGFAAAIFLCHRKRQRY